MSSMGVDLSQILGAGGGGQEAPDPGADQQQQGSRSAEQILREMLDDTMEFQQVEPDDQDSLAMQKVSTMLQEILTKRQQESDQMMAGKSTPRAMRRAAGESAGGGY